jgi:tetratricopeptide (TPR) repeat protein
MEAITLWEQALNLIPNPKQEYEAANWLYSSIRDGYFMLNNFEESAAYFTKAKFGGYDNPFIMLRLGQSFYATNKLEEALEYLLRAYMLEGKEIFKGEDKKYFAHLKSKVKL